MAERRILYECTLLESILGYRNGLREVLRTSLGTEFEDIIQQFLLSKNLFGKAKLADYRHTVHLMNMVIKWVSLNISGAAGTKNPDQKWGCSMKNRPTRSF